MDRKSLQSFNFEKGINMEYKRWLCDTCYQVISEHFVIFHQIESTQKFPKKCSSCGKFEYMDQVVVNEDELAYLRGVLIGQ